MDTIEKPRFAQCAQPYQPIKIERGEKLLKAIGYAIGLYRKRCRDCRHWRDDRAISGYEEYGHCNMADEWDCQMRVAKETGFGPSRPGGLHELETKPDFACKLWRLKK